MSTSKPKSMSKPEPGRELDALVAQKVMGFVKSPNCDWWDDANRVYRWIYIPQYSTEIAAAFEVVEKMKLFDKYYLHKKPLGQFHGQNGNWAIKSYEPDTGGSLGEWGLFDYAEAPTAPHVICLAALKLSGAKDA